MPEYTIRRTPETPSLTGDWEGAVWSRGAAEPGTILNVPADSRGAS